MPPPERLLPFQQVWVSCGQHRGAIWGPFGGCAGSPLMLSTCVPDQTYCDRLVQDTPFLTGQGRLSEQQVDRIILQLNRYYPQILTNKEAEKVLRGERGQGTSWVSPLCN